MGKETLGAGLNTSWVGVGQTRLVGVCGAVWLDRFAHSWV
jgi:hypothetical protein